MIKEKASLELVAKGIAINEMKKEGIFVALEKLVTEPTRGSANAADQRMCVIYSLDIFAKHVTRPPKR